jgi:hypothetical protein
MLLHGDGSAGVPSTGSGAGASSTVTNFNADASTNNFNVTINGDARSDTFTPYQAGYYSNYFASGSYIRALASSNLALGSGAWTCESWVFPTSFTTTAGPLWDFRNAGGYVTTAPLIHFNTTGTVQYQSTLTSTTAVSLNTWSHIAIVRNGTTVTIYINGVASGTVTDSTTMTNTYCCIGAVNDAPASYYLTAYVSNARLVVGTAVYTANFTPTTSPLTAISGTQFLSCQSNRFIDNSTNNFTLSFYGSPQVSPAQPFTLPSSVATYGSGYFDGTGDYLTELTATTALNLSSGDWSISFWVYKTATANGSIVNLYNSAGNTSGLSIWIGSGGVKVDNGVSGGVQAGTVVVNAWSYIEVIRSSGTTTIYVNGVSAGTTTQTPNASQYGSFGSAADGTLPHQGYITDLRIVKGTALSSSVPTSPVTAVSGTSLLTTQYNGGGNNSGFKDSSQFNFPITRNGNTTQGTFSPYSADWSNYFNGSSGVTVSSTSSQFAFTGNFTWEAWINLNSLPSSGGAISIICSRGTAASDSAFQFIITNSSGTYRVETTISIGSSDSGLVWNIPTAPTVGTWYHVAAVRNGSSVQAYWNGTAIGSAQTASGTTNTPTVNPSIGFRGGSYNDLFLNGYISNLRMVGSAVYTSNFTPSVIPLTAITETRLLTCQSNRFIDNSTNAFTLTAYSSPSVQGFSPFAPLTVYNPATYGGSGYFDGSGDYLTAPDNAAFDFGSGNFTVECWIYPTVTGSNGGIVNKRAANSSYPPFLLQFNTSTVLFGVSTSGSSWAVFTASAAVSLNAWHHIALVRNGTAITGYVDGAVSITGTATGALTTNSSAIAIGQDQANSGGNAFTGNIADMRLTKGTALYTAAFTPPTAPLTAITNTSLLLNYTNAGILDNSMLNNLETVGNAQISTSVVKYGTASMYFDGTGDCLTTPSSVNFNFGTGNFTIEMWVYATSMPTYPSAAFLLDSRTNASWVIFLASNQLYFGDSTGTEHNSGTVSTNAWYHIAICRSSGTTTGYINGVSAFSFSDTGSYVGSPILTIGARYTNTLGLNGYIDDLRITKGYARYTTTFTPPTQAFPNG